MKPNSSIFLISVSPQFNKDEIPRFQNFDAENSYQLYSALTLNHKEILDSSFRSYQIAFCFDEKDITAVPDAFTYSQRELIFGSTLNRANFVRTLSEKYFRPNCKSLLIFSNAIGIAAGDIQRAFNLLSIEDEAIVIGKSISNCVAFIGFNSNNPELISEIDWNNLNFEYYLSKVNKHDNYVHVLGNFM